MQTALMFKCFGVEVKDRTNTAVKFTMKDAIEVKVKNDNFATQVEIYDPTNSVDFFDYKYITFDQHAFFEITDCVKNGKYATLFIQYVSDIEFYAYDYNFRVKARTISRLQSLGLDLSELVQILGNAVQQEQANYYPSDNAPFIYAVKIRFSEIPQNLKYAANGGNTFIQANPYGAKRGTAGNALYNPSERDSPSVVPTKPSNFRTFDNAITAYLFLPNAKTLRIKYGASGTPYIYSYDFNLQDCLHALDALITDLTLSVELTIINEKSIFMIDGDVVKPIAIENTQTDTTISFLASKNSQIQNSNRVLKWLRFIGNTPDDIHLDMPPVLLLQADRNAARIITGGFWESLNIIYFSIGNLYTTTDNGSRIYIGLKILNNVIDLSKFPSLAESRTIYIKRGVGFLRVFANRRKMQYQDIQTTFEYAKNAYSNYDAYKAANLDLVNKQNFDALRLQQKQQRYAQNLDTAKNIVGIFTNTIKGGLGGFLSGGGGGAAAGAASNLIGGALNVGFDEVKFNAQQQNDRANQKLAAEQAHERATKTIVPSSDINGSINSQLYIDCSNEKQYDAALFCVYSVDISSVHDVATMQKYIFEKALTDDIIYNGISPVILKNPEWNTLNNVFQVKIENRNPLNTRKDFTIYVRE